MLKPNALNIYFNLFLDSNDERKKKQTTFVKFNTDWIRIKSHMTKTVAYFTRRRFWYRIFVQICQKLFKLIIIKKYTTSHWIYENIHNTKHNIPGRDPVRKKMSFTHSQPKYNNNTWGGDYYSVNSSGPRSRRIFWYYNL